MVLDTFKVNDYYSQLGGGPASQPQSTLSCGKEKNSDLGAEKPCWSQLSVLTLDVKIVWFDCQVAVCVRKWHKNAISGCSQIPKFNFECLLHNLMISLIKTYNIFKFVCPLCTNSSIMIVDNQIYFTLFLTQSLKS